VDRAPNRSETILTIGLAFPAWNHICRCSWPHFYAHAQKRQYIYLCPKTASRSW